MVKRVDKTNDQNELHRIVVAKNIAKDIVETVEWPWTERQKRLWYIGVLAGVFKMDILETASLDELQQWQKELSK